MKGKDPVYHASAAVVLSALNGNDPQGFNMANTACAAENILLMATEFGLASRYVAAPVMAFSDPQLTESLKLPEDYEPLCLVLIGHGEFSSPEKRIKDQQYYIYQIRQHYSIKFKEEFK